MTKRKVFITYNQLSGEVIEIRIKSFNGKLLEQFKFKAEDSVRYGKVIDDVYRKYGYKPSVPYQDSVTHLNTEKKKIEEIDFFGN